MAQWIDVTDAADLPPGAKVCTAQVVVANVDGNLHAIENHCPHAGMPLGEGELRGKIITCPFHGYAFRIDTGLNVDYPDDVPAKTLPVRVENGTVQVDIDP